WRWLLDALAQAGQDGGQILAQRAVDENLRNPESRVEIHLVLDQSRRAVGARGQDPGAFLLLQVAADAVKVDAMRTLVVRPEYVADGGHEPGVADLVLDVLPAPIGRAPETAAMPESGNEQRRLPAVGHDGPDGLRP